MERPPRIARWLIAAVTARDDRPWLVGDLDELYMRRRPRGRWRADAWYWQQVVRSTPLLIHRRLQLWRTLTHSSPSTTMISAHDVRPPAKLAASLYHLRHAFRRLTREPAFTAAAVLTLALGVGGNMAVFAVVEAVLLRPLPYPNADRLVILNHRDQRTGITKEFIAVGDYVDLAARQSSFDAVGAYGSTQMTVVGPGEPYRVNALLVTPGALDAVGMRPTLGRVLQPDDARVGGASVIVLGHELWKAHFGSDPHVIGTSLKVGDTTRTIVGVAPPGFLFRSAKPAELIAPLVMPVAAPAQRKSSWAFMVARLKPDRSLHDASEDLARISRQLEQEYPQSNRGSAYFAVPLRDAMVGNTRPALLLLLAAVGVVLLIACANVANLLLARSLGRRREMAVRLALGASRGRLAAQLLSESFALAVVACVLGTVVAYWGARALATLVPQSVEAPGLANVRVNGAVLLFALILTFATTLAFGLVAMLTVHDNSASGELVGAGRLTTSVVARRTASGLVVAEVALAIVLLLGAGLLMRTFAGLLSADPGFRYDRVMTTTIALPADRYQDSVARQGYYQRAFAALRAVPGVEEVGAAVVVPLTGNNWTVPFERPEHPVPAGERAPDVGWQVASGGYFKALGIPLLAGRLFNDRDRIDSPPVVIVSEAIQRRYFPNESAVGHQIKLGSGRVGSGDGPGRMEIVGVVGNIRRAGLRDDPRADMYFPFERTPSQSITLFVRTAAADPTRVVPALQAALRSVDAGTIFLDSQSLADVAAESVRTTKLLLLLLGVFAATALVLAAVGIYGVMSYVVRQRTREIGTRIALGATRRDILLLVMRQGAAIAAGGTAAGLAVGLAATRSLNSVLYGVSASDPSTLAGATVVLVATIMAACYLPARRAASVDPARTLAEQ